MYKKILIGLCFTSMILSLVGCGNVSKKEEIETNISNESIVESEIVESIIENTEIISEEILDLNEEEIFEEYEMVTPYTIIRDSYGFESLITKDTFDYETSKPANIDLFYSDEGFVCKHNGLLHMISYMSETFGYDILDGARILKPSQIKEQLGIGPDLYQDACVILGNKYSDYDWFVGFRLSENIIDKELYCDKIKDKMNYFIDEELAKVLDTKEFERISGTIICSLNNEYVFMICLGKDEVMDILAYEDVFPYFSGSQDIAVQRLTQLISRIKGGIINDDYFESNLLKNYDLKGMTREEYEEHLNNLVTIGEDGEHYHYGGYEIIDESATIVYDIEEIEQSDTGVY